MPDLSEEQSWWTDLFIGPDPGLQIPEDVWETALTVALEDDISWAADDLVPTDDGGGLLADELTDEMQFHHDFGHHDPHDWFSDSYEGGVETDPHHIPFAEDLPYDIDEPDDS
jgi:hypothetical protein